MLSLLSEIDNVEEVFTNVIHLPPLTTAEVRRLVESRIEHGHLDVTFQPTRLGRLLDELHVSRGNERVYRSLLSASGGNPARVLALCREAFCMRGNQLTLRADAVQRPARLTFAFSEAHLAILATLHRYGPASMQRLRREVALVDHQLKRSVAFLIASGLVRQDEDEETIAIADVAQWSVDEALRIARLRNGS
jgi:hypothetical protein